MKKLNKIKILSLIMCLVVVISTVAYANPVHKDIFKEASAENIYNHIVTLASRDNARVTGFEGEHKSADYIAEQFKSYGLKVDRQEFPILAFSSNGAEVNMTAPEAKTFQAGTLTYSPPTSKEGLTGEVVDCGLGITPEEFPESVKGRIALIQRGNVTFYQKVSNAAKAGAIGVVVYNNGTGKINATLGSPTDIPVATILKADGELVKQMLTNGQKVTMTMKVNTVLKDSYSQNVIGTLEGTRGNKNTKTIIIGAHYDGVDTPAANDNASGISTLLEVARLLSTQKLYYNVKFVAFGAEEVGLVGSKLYVDNLDEEELNNIAAMINMDMVGVGNKISIVKHDMNAESFVADLAETYLNKFGLDYRKRAHTSSDHAYFGAAGIPTVSFDYSPDPYYHTDEDTLDKIQKDNLYNMCTLVTAMTYDMAKTPMPESMNGLKAKANKYHFQNDEIPEQ